MRLKFKPWAHDFIIENKKAFIYDEDGLNEYLADAKEIKMELGCGKGQFIHTLAKQNPNIKYVACDLYESVIVVGAQKWVDEPLDNLKFYAIDVAKLSEFEKIKGRVDTIYLNFSDPWPKKRHAKRRLTHKNFLDIYERLLKEDGHIEFKTDNQSLFEFSLESFSKANYIIEDISLDLHNTERENIKTEFEEKFSNKGFRINYLKAYKRR